jgi:DNA-binding NarL/FixJ family response regulator
VDFKESGMRLTIAVVDRSAMSAALMCEKLSARGFDAMRVSNLEETLHLAGEPQAVLWSFAWPHDKSELNGLQHYTSRRRILVVGCDCPADAQCRMLLAGCRGFVDAGESFEALAAAIRRVCSGVHRFSEAVLSSGVDALSSARTSGHPQRSELTAREMQIVAVVVRGASNKEIASQLQLKDSTVKTHLQTIFRKLGVSSRLGLALQVLREPQLGHHAEQAAIAAEIAEIAT